MQGRHISTSFENLPVYDQFDFQCSTAFLLFSQTEVSSLESFRCREFCMPLYFVQCSLSVTFPTSNIPKFKMKNKDKIKSLNLLTVNTHTIEKEVHRLSFPAGMEQLYCSSGFLRASFSLFSSMFIYYANCCLEKNKEKYYTKHVLLVLRGKVLF